jgi:hypothetical protein
VPEKGDNMRSFSAHAVNGVKSKRIAASVLKSNFNRTSGSRFDKHSMPIVVGQFPDAIGPGPKTTGSIADNTAKGVEMPGHTRS